LDFVLEIEAANPNAGEAPLNSHPVPEEKLQPLIQNFFGDIGNFAQNSHGFTQNAQLGISTADLRKFVSEMSAHLAQLNLNGVFVPGRRRRRRSWPSVRARASLAKWVRWVAV
jgi:hypothetical protein